MVTIRRAQRDLRVVVCATRRAPRLPTDEQEEPVLPHGIDPFGVQVEAERTHRVDELRAVERHGVPVADRVTAAQGQRVVQCPQA